MSAFVITDSGGDSGGLSFPIFPITMVFFKVAVSCYAAVISDAKLKGFSDMSMSAKLSQMSMARVFSSIVIATFMEPEASPSLKSDVLPFFHHFDFMTWVVVFSFTSKSLITLYLLKILDSVQKNIGEALAVLVIFIGQVTFGGSVFNLCAFLQAVLVVILVRIYGMAGKVTQSSSAPLGPTPVLPLHKPA